MAKGGLDDAELTALSEALERAGSWVRRMTPRTSLSPATVSTLAALVGEGPMRISDLVARERISQPGMTTLVSRLADAGYVRRHADPTDGRAALVAPTDDGRAFLAALHAERATVLARRIRRLPPAQQRALHAALGALDALSAASPAIEPDSTPQEGQA